MSADTWQLLDPCGYAAPRSSPRAPHRRQSHEQVLGIVSNGKPSGTTVLNALADELRARLGFADVIRVSKPAVGQPCPSALLDDLARRVDVVLNGVGD